jgi:penicillin-binding protein 1A
MFIYYSAVYPDPMSLRPAEGAPFVRVLARDGSLLAERGGADNYVPLDLLPRHVADAVIATEDQRFYEHGGVDPLGMLRAALANMRSGRYVQGGSTLTQQLAKNLYLSSDRTFSRKLTEFSLALWLEARLSKADILELYLNRVYLGSGAYGIDQAARRYFGKSARKLTLAEAAMIAGLLKAPSRYSPLSNPTLARQRARLVLSQMLDAGFIGEGEAKAAAADVARSFEGAQHADARGAEYAVDFALDQLAARTSARGDGVVVETTLDRPLQARTAAIVEQYLAERGESLAVGEAAVVVLDRDGALLAMVGGRSYAESQFNRAVRSVRQPGSAFKPFVYLAALEAGWRPDSVVEDLPIMVGGWAPRNDNGEYQGRMTMQSALARSINSVAVRLAVDMGPARVATTAKRLGIKSPLAKDASLALGTSEVTLLELTAAYDALANGGRAVEPYIVRRVRTLKGDVLFAHQFPAARQTVALANVGAMNTMLNAALNNGTGRRAVLPEHPAAGKTGTTQSFRDAWFIGYTAHMTAGVWAGNDDGRAMNRVAGGSLPAEIWRDVMIAAHQGKPPTPLAGTMPGVIPPPPPAPLDPAYPTSSIDTDFIARALDQQPQAN